SAASCSGVAPEHAAGARHEAAATNVAPVAAAEPQSNEFRWRKALAAGRVVEVKGVNGNVRAEPASGGEVEVVATKTSRREDTDTVRVEAVEHADGVTICAVYPSRDAAKPNVCAPGEGGRMNVQNNDVKVDFVVRVPAGVRFAGRTVNGNVDATGMGADVDASAVNGNVKITTTGMARASTVNGSVTAAMGSAGWSDELSFSTVNGKLDLTFPASLSAEVNAETVNGDIMSDFPLTITGRYSKRKLNGTIGGGGRELHLRTVNGDVMIRRAS
ncbi:MAG TPA: DUF4097 family beta strand repeat-containing protein, partial [Pyrinomonadaceae bacterium]|nr:DUF4097 family beta strand repeat-containing protein [Pyrinomonadaceae bacterium]